MPRLWSVPHTNPGWRLYAALILLLLGGGLTPLWAQTGTIRGRLVDEATGNPLVGAQIEVRDARLGGVSDARGHFLLVNVPVGTASIRLSALGYATRDLTIQVSPGEVALLELSMTQQAIALDEIVVTATGEARKRELGNSVSTVNVSEIAVPATRGTEELLLGRSTGVSVMANSGQPGTGGTIRIRGNNSISQGNDPIIYVDGVRIHNGSTPTNLDSRQAASPLQDINPADIERIEIVKGPAATTLYGTEASGGVVQIFTKRGYDGPATWTAELASGFNSMGHVGPKGDPTGLYINRCRGSGLVTGDGKTFEDATCPSSGSWLRKGPIQRYSLSVRGGGSELSYFASGYYGDEGGVLPTGGSTDGGFRTSLSFRPAPSIGISATTSYTKRHTVWFPDGNNGSGFMLNVTRGPGSNFKGAGCSDGAATCVRNADLFESNSTTNNDHFILGLTVSQNPRENITNRLSIGYDFNRAIIETVYPFGYVRFPEGEYHWRDWNRTLLTIDLASSIRHELGSSYTSNFSVGGQIFDSRLANLGVEAKKFSGPGVPTVVSAATRDVTGDARQRVINAGLFIQEVIGWEDRFFLTAGLRIDGNSAFGSNFGLQPYPKVSASYILSEHDFWPIDLVQTMKLRGAVGESGKAPGAFDAVKTWRSVAGDDGQPGFTPDQLGNPDLGPERTREFEVGFEASALAGRLGIDLTLFRQNTIDALVPVVYAPSNGFRDRQLENVGTLRNTGLELSLEAALIRSSALDWRGRFNISNVKSEAVDLSGEVLTVSTTARTYVVEGYPVPAYVGKKVMNPNAYADPIIEEDTFLGSAYPDKVIGIGTTLTLYDRLTLDVLGAAQRGHHLLNGLAYQNSAGNRQTWQPCYGPQKLMAEGRLDQVKAIDRMRCSTGSDRDYDYWVEPADFFKLRSVSLSYRLPDRLIPGTRGATLAVAGRNLFTITDYTGTDPEISDTRDSSVARRDYYNFPTPRSFLATLRINF